MHQSCDTKEIYRYFSKTDAFLWVSVKKWADSRPLLYILLLLFIVIVIIIIINLVNY